MPNWKPLMSPATAEVFRKLGWVEDRDFYVSPDLTGEEIAAYFEEDDDA